METGLEGVYAAGDVALGPTAFGEAHESHALWPTAVEHGKVAGAEMAGGRTAYRGSLNMNVTELFGLTVASLGRLAGGEPAARELEAWELFDPQGPRYLRILTRRGVPLGATALGEPADAALLGRLRPFVRLRRPLPDPARLLAGGAAGGQRRAEPWGPAWMYRHAPVWNPVGRA
jgi:NADPH-dependent 2,4-dienoyl-CoA reductase/sulfur reductase-like enzyme